MTGFSFTTQGMEVGYGEDGFFVFGETTKHEFDDREWVGYSFPQFRGKPLSWRIDIAGHNKWDDYERHEADRGRAEILKPFFAEYGQPLGYLWKWDAEEITLSYSLSPDPSFAAFIMGVIAAEREIVGWCQGFVFANKEGAPAPTVEGFMENKQPVFLRERPILRVK